MFDYTKDYLGVLQRDFKRAELVFSVVNVIATIVYPIFAIFAKIGNLYVNIAVLVLAVLYGILQLFIGNIKKYKIDRVYAWCRIGLSTLALGINIYSIYIATTNVNGVAIILATIMTIFWILKVILNLVYDIIMPRIHTLSLCLIEDAKPYANTIDSMSNTFIKRKIFNLSKTVPDEVIKATKKAKEIAESRQKNALNDQIKDEYNKIIGEADINNDGTIDCAEMIIRGLAIPDVIVDKDKFIHQEFTSLFDKNKIDRLIKNGPTKAGLSELELIKYSNKLIAEGNDYIEIAKKHISIEKTIEYKDEKDFLKFLQSFSLTLIVMQKIIYLYGFKQIDFNGVVDENQLTALVLALSIVVNDDEANEAQAELYKLHKDALKNAIKKIANDKINYIKNHGETIKNGMVLGLPVVLKIMSHYSTSGKVFATAASIAKTLKK